MNQRGDIVIVRFPYASGTQSKLRPGLVVQCEANNRRLHNTIIAAISSNTRLVSTEPSQCLVDPGTPEGQSSGLSYPSAVKCENLFTIANTEIQRKIGELPQSLMQKIDACLKAALQLA